jgi:hypothetical protein
MWEKLFSRFRLVGGGGGGVALWLLGWMGCLVAFGARGKSRKRVMWWVTKDRYIKRPNTQNIDYTRRVLVISRPFEHVYPKFFRHILLAHSIGLDVLMSPKMFSLQLKKSWFKNHQSLMLPCFFTENAKPNNDILENPLTFLLFHLNTFPSTRRWDGNLSNSFNVQKCLAELIVFFFLVPSFLQFPYFLIYI